MTLDCLRSIYAQTRDVPFELLVVDNASSDGSAAVIAREFTQARLFALDQNLGFAAANNFAARHARGDWMLLLNPDTVVLDGAMDKLVAFAEEKQARDSSCGIFGGRTVFADGKLNAASCWGRPTAWSAFCIASGLSKVFSGSRLFNSEAMPRWRRDSVRQVDIVSGCFFLLRRALWERLGGFDPAFFMYGEEADLCLRARKLGVKCLICPDATIIHHGGASERLRANKKVRLFRAKAQLFERHWSGPAAHWGVLMLDLWAFSRLLVSRLTSLVRPAALPTYESWKAVWQQRAQWHVLASDSSVPAVTRPVRDA